MQNKFIDSIYNIYIDQVALLFHIVVGKVEIWQNCIVLIDTSFHKLEKQSTKQSCRQD